MLFGHTVAVQLFIDNFTHGKPVCVRHILSNKFFFFFDQNFPIDMKKLLFELSSRNSVGRFLLKIHC